MDKLFFKIGGDNSAYYSLAKKIRSEGIYISTKMGGFFDEEKYIYNGNECTITTDVENGIGYSIEY